GFWTRQEKIMPKRESQVIGGRPKSADVKEHFTKPPPLRQPRQLAEGVEFPERYTDFSAFGPSLGGGGSNLREIQSLAASPIIRRRGPPCWTATRLRVFLTDTLPWFRGPAASLTHRL